MKKTFYILAAVTLTTLFSAKMQAQVSVMGHATAQIVEAASLSANTSNNISVDAFSNASTIQLGEISVNATNSPSCEIIVKSEQIIGNDGLTFNMETSAKLLFENTSLQNSSNRKINLSANTNIPAGHSGRYSGAYSVVLAYN
ncbi:MAG: hypothetical protein AB7S40_09405 [Bacteroidales bacterium]